MRPNLDSLPLTKDELEAARKQVRDMAFSKWHHAGCPEDDALAFWLEAEHEWIQYYYVPSRGRQQRPSS